MYEPNSHSLFTYTSPSDFFLGHFPSLEVAALPPPLLIPTAAAESIEFDPMTLPLRSEVGYSSSTCSSYGSPSSLTSYSTPSPSLMQRSVSSQSLQKNNNNNNNSNNGYRKMAELMMESETSPVVLRRVFSTGDLQYACRKTLADSRPRIKGRFAKNDKIVKNSQNQWSHMGVENDEDYDNWINFLDSFSANLIP
ncbi:hypothetical protein TEA_023280 [Camellia sinensis var. sinensis]|uniref:CCT domain-containing protein n=1 Tax=Camellia sinensis var. sinensis TaxID=542762 RepID=A0A4S4DE26_CAMSN|nr:hypothetical protein TEA_023280 [Camellia sinensis var. sinensis]